MTYDDTNIFARILRGEIPCKKVHEDDFALAFHDIAPAAPTHVLVIPKHACISFDDFIQSASAETVKGFFSSVQHVAKTLGLTESGYRIISNHGADASQSVAHFHVHILGGRPLGGLVPEL
jgi:diadenosine tetraphosphate (Ap4A) HIT family hydrolase